MGERERGRGSEEESSLWCQINAQKVKQRENELSD